MSATRVLVVEDESIIAEDLKDSLINLGYTVPSIESTGEKAIKKAEEIKPDLVLMDIVLHGNMDGIEAAKEIRSRFDIPVVYLTSYSDEEILERAKITEPYGYIIKPFNERELHINIEIAIYKHMIEKRLRDSEHWLYSTLRSLGEAVISTDRLGTIKTMNPFAEALTGWEQEISLEKPLSSIFNIVSEKPGLQVENPVNKVIREGMFYGLAEHTILITKSGMKVPVDIIGSLIKDDKEKIIGIVLVFDDIIERKRMEENMKLANIK